MTDCMPLTQGIWLDVQRGWQSPVQEDVALSNDSMLLSLEPGTPRPLVAIAGLIALCATPILFTLDIFYHIGCALGRCFCKQEPSLKPRKDDVKVLSTIESPKPDKEEATRRAILWSHGIVDVNQAAVEELERLVQERNWNAVMDMDQARLFALLPVQYQNGMALLQQNEEFLANYRKGVHLLLRSWGWDAASNQAIHPRDALQNCFNADAEGRISQMARSLKSLGENHLFMVLQTFAKQECFERVGSCFNSKFDRAYSLNHLFLRSKEVMQRRDSSDRTIHELGLEQWFKEQRRATLGSLD